MNLPVSLGFMGFFWISQKVELQSISTRLWLRLDIPLWVVVKTQISHRSPEMG